MCRAGTTAGWRSRPYRSLARAERRCECWAHVKDIPRGDAVASRGFARLFANLGRRSRDVTGSASRHAPCSSSCIGCLGPSRVPRKADRVVFQVRHWSGVRRRPRRLVLATIGCAVAALALSSCVSQTLCDGPTGPCVQTGGPAEAAATAAIAGAVWVGGGGCAIAGCRPPRTCNTGSGLCELVRCGEGSGPCPPATTCDSVTRTCR